MAKESYYVLEVETLDQLAKAIQAVNTKLDPSLSKPGMPISQIAFLMPAVDDLARG